MSNASRLQFALIVVLVVVTVASWIVQAKTAAMRDERIASEGER